MVLIFVSLPIPIDFKFLDGMKIVIHRKANETYGDRVITCTYDAARYIVHAHRVIGHGGTRKTHRMLSQ